MSEVVGFRNQETRVLRDMLKKIEKGEAVSAILVAEEGGDMFLAFWGDMSKIEMMGALESAKLTVHQVLED